MGSPPRSVLDAIQQLSHRVLCVEDCFSSVEIRYSTAWDTTVIAHPDAHCDCVLHPDGESARALSEFVTEELSRFVALAQYGEPAPIHVGAS